MAKKSPTRSTVALPKGFKSVRAEQSEYFAKPRAGLVIRGVLKGRFPKRGLFGGFYYQILALEPVEGVQHKVGPKEYDEGATAPIGSIVSIDEKGGLAALERQADGTQEVFISCGDKRDIGNGKTAWDFVVGVKPFSGAADEIAF